MLGWAEDYAKGAAQNLHSSHYRVHFAALHVNWLMVHNYDIE